MKNESHSKMDSQKLNYSKIFFDSLQSLDRCEKMQPIKQPIKTTVKTTVFLQMQNMKKVFWSVTSGINILTLLKVYMI